MSPGRTRIEVALPLPIHRTFTYDVPGPTPAPGTRVLVPFRREERVGWVVGPAGDEPVRGIRSVLAVLEAEPSVPAELLELCGWMASYYVSPLGVALRAALPAVLSEAGRTYVEATGPVPDGLRARERKVAEWLVTQGGRRRVRTARRALGLGSIWPEIRALVGRGFVSLDTVPPPEPSVRTHRVVRVSRTLGTLAERDERFGRAGRQREAYELLEASGGEMELARLLEVGFSRPVVRGLEDKGLIEVAEEESVRDPFAEMPVGPAPALEPTRAQAGVLAELTAALGDEEPGTFLLHGITGSGKTLVYIELIRAALARGRTAVVLVPEIALTPQTVSRFRGHFGDEVAVLHSGLSAGERYDAWRQLRRGEKRVAVGARSALFAPLDAVGVIVVDEEHEGSYKQSDAPRYHARDLAVVRARENGAVCVLGSATPSLESWQNARTGKFRLLSLPERVGGGRLPSVDLVDLRVARKARAEGRAGLERGRGVLSEPLVAAVDTRLRRGEQVILLLNRRGYSSFVQCLECGEVDQCENCSISLTYHRVTARLVCHHCRFEIPAPRRCNRCGSADLSYRGLGTEQVERVAAETFPGARIARMDVDTTSGKWAHQRILDRVGRGEIDILLGTQMIAKGLDFPRVTLVGVVNADVGIHLPDFRAAERTFQLLSQVAGRAGRSALGGEVVIQTSLPEHYAIQAAVAHDYEAFATRELRERRGPRYPPGVRLLNAVVSSPDQRLAARAAERAAAWTRALAGPVAKGGVEVIGPAPAPIERLHGRWRWHFLLRCSAAAALGRVASGLARDHKLPSGDVRLALDRDPVALL